MESVLPAYLRNEAKAAAILEDAVGMPRYSRRGQRKSYSLRSIRGHYQSEGFCIPTMEGYLQGKPVVASNRCAVPDVVTSQDYLAEGILDLLLGSAHRVRHRRVSQLVTISISVMKFLLRNFESHMSLFSRLHFHSELDRANEPQ